MSDFLSALLTELDEPVFHEFYAIELKLPSYTLRLIDGAGFVKFDTGEGEEKFIGFDDIYGSVDSMDNIRDGFGDTAPAFSFTILPSTDGAIAALTDPAIQMSGCKVWLGTRDPQTNAVTSPALRFDGFLDYSVLEGEPEGGISIDMECVTWHELFFRVREGVTLSDAHHTANWPGETGLSFVSGIQRTIIWGPGDKPSSLSYRRASGGGGGNDRTLESFVNVDLQ